jgi:DNA adenine methylase
MGGKFRTGKAISQWINEYRDPGQVYLEPFVGGAWVLERVYGPDRLASDVLPDLIFLYRALQEGWVPPDKITPREYEEAKASPSSPLRAFIGFSCGFAGRFFRGTWERNQIWGDAPARTKRTLLRQIARMPKDEVSFSCCDYREWDPDGFLVYCDPPYASGDSSYAKGSFDSREFWEVVRRWARKNTVLVSEYEAPDFCRLLQSFDSTTGCFVKKKEETAVDKLWLVRP